ncbi:hypothetical protein EIP91_004511 [Steccherinum ochraceum]|uniref:DUF7918 domain-containing protein n=1 Tax=Steccherinum ochraceum TaxID=92696 RepID=A0A4R0R8N6_9APHY|nr:hypothetical protein EIP91_004511 [Steccherinum ochraceum]
MVGVKAASIDILNESMVAYKTYGKTSSEGKVVAVHIASEAGTNFSIEMRNGRGLRTQRRDFCFNIHVDGVFVLGQIVYPEGREVKQGLQISTMSLKRFTFAKVDVTDADGLSGENVGVIEVKILRCITREPVDIEETEHHPSEHKFRRTHRLMRRSSELINETSKKAGLHQVRLGEEIPYARPQKAKVDYLDTDDDPYASVKFLYRPPTVLQALGVMPRWHAPLGSFELAPSTPPASTSQRAGTCRYNLRKRLQPTSKPTAGEPQLKRRRLMQAPNAVPTGQPAPRDSIGPSMKENAKEDEAEVKQEICSILFPTEGDIKKEAEFHTVKPPSPSPLPLQVENHDNMSERRNSREIIQRHEQQVALKEEGMKATNRG